MRVCLNADFFWWPWMGSANSTGGKPADSAKRTDKADSETSQAPRAIVARRRAGVGALLSATRQTGEPDQGHAYAGAHEPLCGSRAMSCLNGVMRPHRSKKKDAPCANGNSASPNKNN